MLKKNAIILILFYKYPYLVCNSGRIEVWISIASNEWHPYAKIISLNSFYKSELHVTISYRFIIDFNAMAS